MARCAGGHQHLRIEVFSEVDRGSDRSGGLRDLHIACIVGERWPESMESGEQFNAAGTIKVKVQLIDGLELWQFDENACAIPEPVNGTNLEAVVAFDAGVFDRKFGRAVGRAVAVVPLLRKPKPGVGNFG